MAETIPVNGTDVDAELPVKVSRGDKEITIVGRVKYYVRRRDECFNDEFLLPDELVHELRTLGARAEDLLHEVSDYLF